MVLKLLSKKHMENILKLLNGGEELYVQQINDEIKINKSNLSQLLQELQDNGFVSKRIDEDTAKNLPKSYFKLTEKGKRALKVYEMIEELK